MGDSCTSTPLGQRDDWFHRAPRDLSVTALRVNRILVIGSCFSEAVVPHVGHAFPQALVDYIPYNFAGELPDNPPHPIESYAFQLIVLPMRTIVPEQLTLPLTYLEPEGYRRAFDESRQRLLHLLEGAMVYHKNHSLLTFVANFMVPQQNSMGRLLPRYDLRNPVYYCEKLNEIISIEISRKDNTYIVDFDAISATIGRKYIQDDTIWIHAHATCISSWDEQYDQGRLEHAPVYPRVFETKTDQFYAALWNELRASLVTIRQIDAVKLVIIDLDDTIWRGVVAEEGIRYAALEGRPLGFIEALKFLKQRGILLAIASKNDEATLTQLWPSFVGGILPLSDFAVRKINWKPKVENIQEILSEANLLPSNAIFIDDNPVERASVKEAFPTMRVMGDDIYRIRSMLLWSGETQVAHVTRESGRRTEMVQAQIEREDHRKRMSRAEFLHSLDLNIVVTQVTDVRSDKFARILELLNKSNQFNTTGRRWTHDECARAFAEGTVVHVGQVIDKYTDYGLVAVAIVTTGHIEQYVMSCRVIGLGVERAMIAEICRISFGRSALSGSVVETPANMLGRQVYADCGFVQTEPGLWTLEHADQLTVPAHIAVVRT